MSSTLQLPGTHSISFDLSDDRRARKDVRLNWKLSDVQMAAMRVRMMEKYRRILFGGGTGGGKTEFAIRDLIIAGTKHYPGDNFLLIRYDLEALKKYFWKRFVEMIPPELVRRRNDSHRPSLQLVPPFNTWYYGVDGKSPTKWWGEEFRAAYIDEGQEIPSRIYELMETRFRSKLVDAQGEAKSNYHYIFITANPAPGYLKESFVDEETRPADHIYIPCLADDNAFIDVADYKRRTRLALTDAEYRRYMEGDWKAFEGQVYPEFDTQVHVSDFKLDSRIAYSHIQPMDWGFSSFTVVLFAAIDHRGDIWIYDEIVLSRTTPKHVAAQYFERCEKWGLGPASQIIPIDPSANKTERDGGNPEADLIDEEMPIFPADNTRRGIMTVKAWLERTKLQGCEELPDEEMHPGIHIHERCARLIWEMPRYMWDTKTLGWQMRNNLPDMVVKKDDHALDALRYLANYMVPGQQIPRAMGTDTPEAYFLEKERAERDKESPWGGVQPDTVPARVDFLC